MKLLLDANLGRTLRTSLMEDGHDVAWVGDWAADPGDNAVLDRAYQEGRILITQDKDFGRLAILMRVPHRGIIRLRNVATRNQPAVVLRVLAEYADELSLGAIVTATDEDLRIRRADAVAEEP